MIMSKVTAIMAVKANTRLVLATELVARNVECEELRALVSELRVQLERERVCTEYFNSERVAPKVIAPRTLPAHFVAAREAAMRLGRSVKVEA